MESRISIIENQKPVFSRENGFLVLFRLQPLNRSFHQPHCLAQRLCIEREFRAGGLEQFRNRRGAAKRERVAIRAHRVRLILERVRSDLHRAQLRQPVLDVAERHFNFTDILLIDIDGLIDGVNFISSIAKLTKRRYNRPQRGVP